MDTTNEETFGRCFLLSTTLDDNLATNIAHPGRPDSLVSAPVANQPRPALTCPLAFTCPTLGLGPCSCPTGKFTEGTSAVECAVSTHVSDCAPGQPSFGVVVSRKAFFRRVFGFATVRWQRNCNDPELHFRVRIVSAVDANPFMETVRASSVPTASINRPSGTTCLV